MICPCDTVLFNDSGWYELNNFALFLAIPWLSPNSVTKLRGMRDVKRKQDIEKLRLRSTNDKLFKIFSVSRSGHDVKKVEIFFQTYETVLKFDSVSKGGRKYKVGYY